LAGKEVKEINENYCTCRHSHLLGLVFFVFGLKGFLLFITPPEHTLVGGEFINLLFSTPLHVYRKVPGSDRGRDALNEPVCNARANCG
jgi:hypothetical protein